MAAFGLSPDDYSDNLIEIWPDNMPAVELFTFAATQWRVGMGGMVGFDYTAIAHLMKMRGIKRKHQAALMDDIAIMESEALCAMRERTE